MSATTTLIWLGLLVSTLLAMSKLRGGFNYRWEYVLSPLTVSMVGSALWHLYELYLERTAVGEHDKDESLEAFVHEQKLNLYNTATHTFEGFSVVVILMDAAEFLNRATISKNKHPDADRLCMTMLISAIISLCLRLTRAAHVKSVEMIKEEGEEYYLEWRKKTKFPIVGILLNQIFNLLGATTMVCAGGACNSIYISSLTLFFSSIGVTLTDWLPYINGLGFVFVAIALVSLYSAKKSFVYPPFIIGCFYLD